jgi:hypothetical protein
MKQKVFLLFLVIIAVCLLLVACQPQQVEVTRVVTETETVTEEVEVTRVVEGEVVTEVQEVEVPLYRRPGLWWKRESGSRRCFPLLAAHFSTLRSLDRTSL